MHTHRSPTWAPTRKDAPSCGRPSSGKTHNYWPRISGCSVLYFLSSRLHRDWFLLTRSPAGSADDLKLQEGFLILIGNLADDADHILPRTCSAHTRNPTLSHQVFGH
jgi:hypothetical protein